jgi:hypothetical protein
MSDTENATDETTEAATVPDESTTAEGTPNTETDGADPDGAEALGEPGKRALNEMKGKWRAERDKRRELEAQLAAKPEAEAETPDVESIKREALASANARIIKAEVKLAAAEKFADPALALRLIDTSAIDVDSDGNVDASDVEDAIDRLLEQYPSLGSAAKAPGFKGTVNAGNTRKASEPEQLSQADLKKMSAEQIIKAKKNGQLKNLLNGN